MLDQDERIQDVTGKTLYTIRPDVNRKLVCEPSGRILGYTAEGSTFKKTGERIALSEQAGLLFDCGEDDL